MAATLMTFCALKANVSVEFYNISIRRNDEINFDSRKLFASLFHTFAKLQQREQSCGNTHTLDHHNHGQHNNDHRKHHYLYGRLHHRNH